MLYVGYVYRFYCLTTGKNYVGITTQDINKRWNQHRNESFGDSGLKDTYFHRALRKYGWDNFEKSVLLKLEADSKEQLVESLSQLETFYIQKYNSYYDGYNSTYGGDGVISETNQKEVLVYNELGVLIETCSSRVEASQKYNVPATSISDCCNRIILSSGWLKDLRLVFRNPGDKVTEEDKIKLCKARKNKPVPVKCYDYCTGKLIAQYNSIIEASNSTGIDSDSISKCYLHKIKSTIQGGQKLVWRKLEEDYIPNYIVEAFVDDQSLGKYVSYQNAGAVLGVLPCHISQCVNRKRKSAGKYEGKPIIWKKI